MIHADLYHETYGVFRLAETVFKSDVFEPMEFVCIGNGNCKTLRF